MQPVHKVLHGTIAIFHVVRMRHRTMLPAFAQARCLWFKLATTDPSTMPG